MIPTLKELKTVTKSSECNDMKVGIKSSIIKRVPNSALKRWEKPLEKTWNQS